MLYDILYLCFVVLLIFHVFIFYSIFHVFISFYSIFKLLKNSTSSYVFFILFYTYERDFFFNTDSF